MERTMEIFKSEFGNSEILGIIFYFLYSQFYFFNSKYQLCVLVMTVTYIYMFACFCLLQYQSGSTDNFNLYDMIKGFREGV